MQKYANAETSANNAKAYLLRNELKQHKEQTKKSKENNIGETKPN